MNLIKALNPAISQYRDRRFHGNQQEFEECLAASTTVYVGNLSFYSTEDQVYERTVKYINGTMLDDRPIRVDFDWGFQEGRQYGRGRSGGQVRDEYRMDYDSGRGGYGSVLRTELSARQSLMAMMGNEMDMGSAGGYQVASN